MANGGGGGFDPVKWGLGIVGSLLALLIVALWTGNARLAVVESNTANIKQVIADHETRVRRLERWTIGGGGRSMPDDTL